MTSANLIKTAQSLGDWMYKTGLSSTTAMGNAADMPLSHLYSQHRNILLHSQLLVLWT